MSLSSPPQLFWGICNPFSTQHLNKLSEQSFARVILCLKSYWLLITHSRKSKFFTKFTRPCVIWLLSTSSALTHNILPPSSLTSIILSVIKYSSVSPYGCCIEIIISQLFTHLTHSHPWYSPSPLREAVPDFLISLTPPTYHSLACLFICLLILPSPLQWKLGGSGSVHNSNGICKLTIIEDKAQ